MFPAEALSAAGWTGLRGEGGAYKCSCEGHFDEGLVVVDLDPSTVPSELLVVVIRL
jgi:hypothetical protein